MRSRIPGGWLGLLLVVGLLFAGVAFVAAQSGGADPNEGAALDAAVDEPVHPLAPEEMVGRSPNEGQLARLEPAPAVNDLPLEAMVGQSPNGDEGELDAEVVAPLAAEEVAAGGGTRFLVTAANSSGANADTSCPAGFHMANLYELTDVTHLTYANVTGARMRADQGGGPVAGWWGWVRTGYDSYYLNAAGRANCRLWSSATSGDYGTVVRLADTWTAAGVAISPWQAQTWSCGGTAPVWCVAD
jgi:hypothetical protein